MPEHPILFTGPNVVAIMEGRKTQTRRIDNGRKPYAAGDVLWVREGLIRPDGEPWLYRADNLPVMVAKSDETEMLTWAHHKEQNYCPSMFMPRWASRLSLRVTEVRRQQLQEISEADAIEEGCRDEEATAEAAAFLGQGNFTAKLDFAMLWDSINMKRAPWEDNPPVYAYTFERIANA